MLLTKRAKCPYRIGNILGVAICGLFGQLICNCLQKYLPWIIFHLGKSLQGKGWSGIKQILAIKNLMNQRVTQTIFARFRAVVLARLSPAIQVEAGVRATFKEPARIP